MIYFFCRAHCKIVWENYTRTFKHYTAIIQGFPKSLNAELISTHGVWMKKIVHGI